MKIEKIILGSASPRRREYVQHLGYAVETIKPDVEEVYPDDLSLSDVPEFLAKLKANSLELNLREGEVLITSDTVVLLDNTLLGKPENEAHAKALLKLLSGKTHEVISGVFLKSKDKSISFSVSTLVTFVELTSDEIETYVDKYKPLDKAGAYGIQEYIGFIGVERIEGSYMNVIGLPLAQIREQLRAF
jgi:septum formation protein